MLITAAGGGGSIEVIKSLRAKGYRVIATDSSKYAGGFAFADRSYVVPLAVDPGFAPAMISILGDCSPNFVAPLVDEEIPVFLELAADARVAPFRLLTPRPEFCEVALDKWRTFMSLRSAGIPIPDTSLASDPGESGWPAVVKPRQGRGGRDVAYVGSSDELAGHIRRTGLDPGRYIVQRQVRGKEYTVSAVAGLGGPLLAVVPKEVVIKKGITLAGVTRNDPEIAALCARIQDRLRPDGPFNVQLIVDENDGPQVIEINPRYSTTVALTMAAGVDEVDLVIRHALGERLGSQPFEPDLLMVRYYVQHYCPERDWHPEAAEINLLS